MSVKKARLSPAAGRDLLEATAWIAQDNPSAARALQAAVARAAVTIGEHSHIGGLCPELARAPFRFLPLANFPYVIVYNADSRPPLIVRVLHGARDLPEVLRNL